MGRNYLTLQQPGWAGAARQQGATWPFSGAYVRWVAARPAFPSAVAHEGRELETAMRSVSKPSARQERDLPSSCMSLLLVRSVANKEAFLYLGKQSTSNSCGFNAVDLPRALTLYSVFSKTPRQSV